MNNYISLPEWECSQVYELGDLLITYLEKLHVEYVFGIPGGAIEPLYNALARSERRGGPRAIVSRHETGAAFMADGYTAQTGKLGVCCATTGPGTTNLVTGVASAYVNCVPMLIITAQTALSSFGHAAFQDSSCTGIDSVGLFKHFTLYSTLVSHVDQLEQKLITAVMTAFGPQPGPVHLSIPLDVLRTPVQPKADFDIQLLLRQSRMYDKDDVERLLAALLTGSPTVFVIGAGASDAVEDILAVVDLIDAKIVVTPHAKGLVNPYHPRFRGILGYGGHRSAVNAVQRAQCNTIVCVGTLMSERAGSKWLGRIAPNQQLIHIDGRETNFAYTPMAFLQIKGCVATIFEQLLNRLSADPAATMKRRNRNMEKAKLSCSTNTQRKNDKPHFTIEDELSYRSSAIPIKPQRLMRDLPKLFPSNTCFLVDSGSGLAWALHYLHLYEPNVDAKGGPQASRFRATVEFTSMGWAIGAAIGTALGSNGDPVVCITGDGSLLMSGQEITIAVEENLPIIFVVLNDSGLGMVKHGQRLTGAERIGYKMPTTDFAAFARTMGAQGYTIKSPEDLANLNTHELCNAGGPTLLDVYIDPEAVPPLANRINTLVEAL